MRLTIHISDGGSCGSVHFTQLNRNAISGGGAGSFVRVPMLPQMQLIEVVCMWLKDPRLQPLLLLLLLLWDSLRFVYATGFPFDRCGIESGICGGPT